MASRTREFSPAMVASVALHLGVFGMAFVSWPWTRELSVGAAVPVNIVSNAPDTNLRQAVQAPEEQVAQTEEPTPEAPAAPAAPDPAPIPLPPQPKPKPAPAPTPAPPAKTVPTKAAKPVEKAPAKPVPKPQRTAGLDLDALEADVAKAARASGSRTSSAAKGPARPETAKVARPDMGDGMAANALKGLADELQRRWSPNCEVEGGRDVRVRVVFTLGPAGQVLSVDAGGKERSSNSVEQAAAERAIRAVYQAAPFKSLPRDFYGDRIAVNFNAREACS